MQITIAPLPFYTRWQSVAFGFTPQILSWPKRTPSFSTGLIDRWQHPNVGQIYRSTMTVIRVRAADERRAWEIIEQYRDKDFSFTDATSFAVMERLHIQHVLTLDRDFVQYGFISLANE